MSASAQFIIPNTTPYALVLVDDAARNGELRRLPRVRAKCPAAHEADSPGLHVRVGQPVCIKHVVGKAPRKRLAPARIAFRHVRFVQDAPVACVRKIENNITCNNITFAKQN